MSESLFIKPGLVSNTVGCGEVQDFRFQVSDDYCPEKVPKNPGNWKPVTGNFFLPFIIFPLNMLIQEDKLQYWMDNFYGYGSWNARFWFISFEESGGELPEEVADKINYFYDAHPLGKTGNLCNIRDLYRHVAVRFDGPKADLFTNRYQFRFDNHAVLHGVWKNLIAFLYGYKHEKLPDLLAYQKETFASTSANQEALIPLFPLPSPHSHAWYYSWLELPKLGFLKHRTTYLTHEYEKRIHTILSNVRIHKPKVVLMYGMENINTLKKSVADFFPDAKFRMIKAIKQQIPQHHRTDFDGTTILITTQIPALRHQRIETGFDWEEFGKKVAIGY